MTDSPQRFLIVRLSSIGDIVHALPAVAALGEAFPRAEIHWAVESRYALLLEGNPYLRRVVKLDTLGWRRRLTTGATLREIGGGLRALRESRYEAAIDFQGLWKSAAVAWLSRARERIGFAKPWLREPGAAVLYTQRISPGGPKHVIEMNLALVEQLGAHAQRWQFPLPRTAADDTYVETQLAALHVKDFIIINPGGGWRSKCWPPESYAELIERLEAVLPEQILLTGSAGEQKLIAAILQRAGSRRACYLPTTLVQLIALARRARLFIGGDTGPLHLAAAVGTPIVGIFGPTDPARNGPFAADDIALSNLGPINHTRREANLTYLPGISVESALAAVDNRLARAHG
jgi:lipopolysaccharide heptosyltransferase I